MVFQPTPSSSDTPIYAALITGIVSLITSLFTLFTGVINTPLKYWFEKKALKNKLATEHEFTQRTKLRSLIDSYRGLMIEAAEPLNHRFWNLYRNDPTKWLEVGPAYAEHYYFSTFLLRVLNLLSIARAFEKEALYIDPRIAEDSDFDFLHLTKAWSWVLTDGSFFDGLSYDFNKAPDHIYRDELKEMCELTWQKGQFVARQEFECLLDNKQLDPLCKLFTGLKSSENRYRWDRLVCFHLLIMIFLNIFGYQPQHTSVEKLRRVADKIKSPVIRSNLKLWVTRLGLDRNRDIKNFSRLL